MASNLKLKIKKAKMVRKAASKREGCQTMGYKLAGLDVIGCNEIDPQDYDFLTEPYYYICGMSVPPVMMAQVASRVYDQWLSKINM